jgi:hypothetical protein
MSDSILPRSIDAQVAVLAARADNEVTRLTRHEDECTKRYTALDSNLTRVHGRIDTLTYAIGGAVVSAVMTLAAVLAQISIHSIK